ncbi:hypothetical protein ACWDAQ_32550, partial [Streptomyces sp. NPDC001139]
VRAGHGRIHDHRGQAGRHPGTPPRLLPGNVDTTTAAPGGDFATAVAMALGAELPLAALCGRLALRALSRLA